MKNILLTIAASIIALSAVNAQQAKLEPGATMPVLNEKLRNATSGRDMVYSIATEKNGLLVIFSCNTCPFVIKNEGTIAKTVEYAKSKGVGVVIINSNEAKRSGDDSYEAMQAYAKKQGYAVPYLVDENSKLADMYGANHTPEIYLFNGSKTLVYRGAMNDNPGSPSEAKVMYINSA